MRNQKGVIIPALIGLVVLVAVGLLAITVAPKVQHHFAQQQSNSNNQMQIGGFDINNVGQVISFHLSYDSAKQKLTVNSVSKKTGVYPAQSNKQTGDYTITESDKNGKPLQTDVFGLPKESSRDDTIPTTSNASFVPSFTVNIKLDDTAANVVLKDRSGSILYQSPTASITSDAPDYNSTANYTFDVVYLVPSDQTVNQTWATNDYNFFCQSLRQWYLGQHINNNGDTNNDHTFQCSALNVVKAQSASAVFDKSEDAFSSTIADELQPAYAAKNESLIEPGHYRYVFVQTNTNSYWVDVADTSDNTGTTAMYNNISTFINKQLNTDVINSFNQQYKANYSTTDPLANYTNFFSHQIAAVSRNLISDFQPSAPLVTLVGSIADWEAGKIQNLSNDAKKILVSVPYMNQYRTSVPAPSCANPTKNVDPDQITQTGGTLHWNAVDGASQYNIYTDDKLGNIINSKPITDNWYTVNGLKPGSKNTFYVLAICAFWPGATSPNYSQSVTPLALTLTTQTAPQDSGGGPGPSATCGAPANLTASSKTSTSVTLSWDAVSSANLDHYNVYQADTYVASPGKQTTQTITNLTPNTNYSFSVHAICSGQNTYSEGRSSPLAVTTDNAANNSGGNNNGGNNNGGNNTGNGSNSSDSGLGGNETLTFQVFDNSNALLANTAGSYTFEYFQTQNGQNTTEVSNGNFTTDENGMYMLTGLNDTSYTFCINVSGKGRACAPLYSWPFKNFHDGSSTLDLHLALY